MLQILGIIFLIGIGIVVVKQQPRDKHGLLLITPEDIPSIEMPRQRTKIGF